MAYLMHKWKPLKLLSMHKFSFLFDNQGTTWFDRLGVFKHFERMES